ncbi:O-antigen ligase family protein [Flavobacteriaceae bacterium F08102]|nr:O-antigen ligase family protein [Flavobacteriaceae bacterium F08102]
MVKKLFYLFVFAAPFTSFFAFSAWLRIPVVVNILVFVVLMLSILRYGKIKRKWIKSEDLYLLAFFGLLLMSYVLGFGEQRSFNHTLAYTNSIFLYFFLSKYLIELFHISSLQIAKVVMKSFVVISLIILIDFIGKNYFNVSFRQFYSEIDGATSNMNYFIRGGMFRVGGVAEEPGIMAMFYNLYFGISLFYIYKIRKKHLYIWVFILYLCAHFALFSNAGITLPFIAVIAIFTFNKLKKLYISKNQLFWVLCVTIGGVLLTISFQFFDYASSETIQKFMNKIFFNEQANSSSGARLHQWSRAISNFSTSPLFGHGPGYGVHEDAEGYLSVYLTILADIGIIAFFFFCTFVLAIFKKASRIKGDVRNFLMFSLTTTFLHLFIIADFYHAPMWLLIAFVQLVYKEENLNSL